MPELMQFETKQPNTVPALYSGMYGEALEDIKVWMESLLVGDDAQVYYGPLGNQLFVVNGAFNMTVDPNNYVFLDEDGFHAVRKDTFEMLYRRVPDGV